jgi:hypothetical protein
MSASSISREELDGPTVATILLRRKSLTGNSGSSIAPEYTIRGFLFD